MTAVTSLVFGDTMSADSDAAILTQHLAEEPVRVVRSRSALRIRYAPELAITQAPVPKSEPSALHRCYYLLVKMLKKPVPHLIEVKKWSRVTALTSPAFRTRCPA